MNIISFCRIKHKFWVRKRNVSGILSVFFISNISFRCVKEKSQGDVPFTHPEHVIIEEFLK